MSSKMKNVNNDLSLIKEKIIRTDEVIKLFLDKKQEHQKLHSKYKFLVNLYSKKCLGEELSNQEMNSLKGKLEEYESLKTNYEELKTKHEQLEITFKDYTNESYLKYQTANQEIEDLTEKLNAKLKSEKLQSGNKDCKSLICQNKLKRIEKKLAIFKDKKKVQTNLIKSLEKEKEGLLNQIENEKISDRGDTSPLISFIKNKLHDTSTNSTKDVYQLIDDIILERDTLKRKLSELEIKCKNYQQENETEVLNEIENIYVENEDDGEIDDLSDDESIDFMLKEHALILPLSPLSMSSDTSENPNPPPEIPVKARPVILQHIIIPPIKITPPTPIVKNFSEVDIRETCTRCKVLSMKFKVARKKLLISYDKIGKLFKRNLLSKRAIRKWKINRRRVVKNVVFCKGLLCKSYNCYYSQDDCLIGFKKIENPVIVNTKSIGIQADSEKNIIEISYKSMGIQVDVSKDVTEVPIKPELELIPKEMDVEGNYYIVFKVFERIMEYIDKKIDICTLNPLEIRSRIISPEEETDFNHLLARYKRRGMDRRLSSSSDSTIKSPPEMKHVKYRETFHNDFDTRSVSCDSGFMSPETFEKESSFSVFESKVSKEIIQEKSSSKEDMQRKQEKSSSKEDMQRKQEKSSSKEDMQRKQEKSSSKEDMQRKPKKLTNLQKLRNKFSNIPKINKIEDSTKNNTLKRKKEEDEVDKKEKTEISPKIANNIMKREAAVKILRAKRLKTENEVKSTFIVKREEAVKVVSTKRLKSENEVRSTFKRPNRKKIIEETPRSPSPEKFEENIQENIKIIPAEKIEKISKDFALETLQKLLNLPNEPKISEEVLQVFSSQDENFIAESILETVSKDIHEKPEGDPSSSTFFMTSNQKVLLGLMIALKKRNLSVTEKFLAKAEVQLLLEKKLFRLSPVLRLYLATCKVEKDIERMRMMCCDAVYFMGDLALPLLNITVTTWTEVIPKADEEKSKTPLLKALIKVIMQTNCSLPGYNVANLKTLIMKYYGYKELEHVDVMFKEFFDKYIDLPSCSLEYAILLLCKYNSKKWVVKKIEGIILPSISDVENSKHPMAVISLVQKLGKLCGCEDEYKGKLENFKNIFKKTDCDN